MIVLGPTDQGTQTQQLEEQAASPRSVCPQGMFSPGALGDSVWPPSYLPVLLVTLGVKFVHGSL